LYLPQRNPAEDIQVHQATVRSVTSKMGCVHSVGCARQSTGVCEENISTSVVYVT